MRFETDRPYAWATTDHAKRQRAIAALAAIMLDKDLRILSLEETACLFITLGREAHYHPVLDFHIRKIIRLFEGFGSKRFDPDTLIHSVDKLMEHLFELDDTGVQSFPYLWDYTDSRVQTLMGRHMPANMPTKVVPMYDFESE